MENFYINQHDLPIIPVKINIKDQDAKFIQIQKLIKAKKEMLLDKQKQLCTISKENDFLNIIKKDYEMYNNYIYKQKQDQIKALQILDKYIEELTNSGKLSQYDIEDAREEQKKILGELDNIKGKLDNIINISKQI